MSASRQGPEAAEPVLEARGLEAILPSGAGIGPIDLAVAPGERVLVLGPSGSGKTSLLRLLHGAIPHAIDAEVRGEVRLGGRTVAEAGVADHARAAGVVAQDPESGVCLARVDEEVAFPLENLAVPRERISPMIDTALGRAGALGLRERSTGELSGGELQRVALAAAIAPEPAVLLLDEPTSMLDAAGVASVRDAIEQARAATGAAVVLVEHRLDELADEAGLAALPERWIALDRNGRVLADAPAEELDAATVRALAAAGCWLPLELELAALLGDGERRGGADAQLEGAAGRRLLALAASDGAARARPGAAEPRPVLRARGLAIARGPRRARRTVLAGLDLKLRGGELVALLGANGTGKSSLLHVLAGLAAPDAGRLEGPRAGLVFQRPEHQFAQSTLRAELAHGLGPDRAADVDRMLERFDLAELAEESPYRLSGGQQRRASLAAMLLHDRPFLLADEPTFGLDRHAQIAALDALRESADEGRGVLFSTHDLRAAAVADRVLVLGDGALLADREPLALFRDAALLERAGLRPPRIVRFLAERVAGQGELRAGLAALDARAMALARSADAGAGHGPDDAAAAADRLARGSRA